MNLGGERLQPRREPWVSNQKMKKPSRDDRASEGRVTLHSKVLDTGRSPRYSIPMFDPRPHRSRLSAPPPNRPRTTKRLSTQAPRPTLPTSSPISASFATPWSAPPPSPPSPAGDKSCLAQPPWPPRG